MYDFFKIKLKIGIVGIVLMTLFFAFIDLYVLPYLELEEKDSDAYYEGNKKSKGEAQRKRQEEIREPMFINFQEEYKVAYKVNWQEEYKVAYKVIGKKKIRRVKVKKKKVNLQEEMSRVKAEEQRKWQEEMRREQMRIMEEIKKRKLEKEKRRKEAEKNRTNYSLFSYLFYYFKNS